MSSRFSKSALNALFIISIMPVYLAGAADNSPTKADVENVMKGTWDKTASSFNPKTSLTLNSIRFGEAYKATVQEIQVEGIPAKAIVTPAIVDFTVRTYHVKDTNALQRVREARIYRDKMGEWAVMTGSVKGQDITFQEPVEK
ncbi:MAG: hypothetical protein ABIR84_08725 [Candidatus Nitrotoga sp.]